MKSNFKLWSLRLYHTIRGYFMLKKFVHGKYYSTKHIPNTRYYYNEGNEFYAAFAAVVCPGVAYEDQRKNTFKTWEISVINLTEC